MRIYYYVFLYFFWHLLSLTPPLSATSVCPDSENDNSIFISQQRLQSAQQLSSIHELQTEYIKGKKILDVGSGTGEKTDWLRSHGAIVYAVEPFSKDFTYALNEQYIEKARAYNCSVEELPSEFDGTFDYITCFAAQFNKREAALKRISELLKPEGKLIMTFWRSGNSSEYKMLKWDNALPQYFKVGTCLIRTIDQEASKAIEDPYYIIARPLSQKGK